MNFWSTIIEITRPRNCGKVLPYFGGRIPVLWLSLMETAIPRKPFRYNVRTLLIVTAVAAVFCTVPVLWRGCYYNERNNIARLLARYPEIQHVSYGGFPDEFTENVVVTTIALRDRDNAILKLCGLENHNDGSFRHLRIQRIGDWTFVVGGYGHSGVTKIATGEPVKSHFLTANVDIGPDSEFKDILPFTVSTLDELLERYDELVAYFETWPTKDNHGTLMFSDGIERYYYSIKPE